MKTYQTMSIKQSAQKRGREKYKMEGPKSRQKEGTTDEDGLQGELEQIKDLNPLHHKEHLG
jgi:hypothetical protein